MAIRNQVIKEAKSIGLKVLDFEQTKEDAHWWKVRAVVMHKGSPRILNYWMDTHTINPNREAQWLKGFLKKVVKKYG